MSPLEILATLVTIGMFLSNWPTIQRYYESKTVGQSSVFPFLSTFVNCVLWCKYGVLVDQTTIIVVNAVGLLIAMGCVFSYWKFTAQRSILEKQIGFVVGFVLVVFIYIRVFYNPSMNAQLGTLCALCSIVMFGSPLILLKQVVRVRSADGLISLPLAALSFACSLLWTLFGFSISDWFVIIPNLLGCVLTIVQLGVYFMYNQRSASLPSHSHPFDEDARLVSSP